MCRFRGLLIALDLIAVASWGARVLVKGGLNWGLEVRGDVLDCGSSKLSPVPHLERVRTFRFSWQFLFGHL